jgi:hypothetical protein
LSLPHHKKTASQYIRLGTNVLSGIGLCLLSTIKYNIQLRDTYLSSAWMIPTICLVYFVNVVITHIRIPGKLKGH